MFGDIIQPTHLLFILVVALLVLGPKRLPEVGRSLGRGLRDFRQGMQGVQEEARSVFGDATDESAADSASTTVSTLPEKVSTTAAPEPVSAVAGTETTAPIFAGEPASAAQPLTTPMVATVQAPAPPPRPSSRIRPTTRTDDRIASGRDGRARRLVARRWSRLDELHRRRAAIRARRHLGAARARAAARASVL